MLINHAIDTLKKKGKKMRPLVIDTTKEIQLNCNLVGRDCSIEREHTNHRLPANDNCMVPMPIKGLTNDPCSLKSEK
jgi:hypothetical protein